MTSLSEFQNEFWTEEENGRLIEVAQVVGSSGVYLVKRDAETEEIIRDDRPWQWQATGFPEKD